MGFTQQEVASRLLTDQTTVSAWEKDKPKSFAGPSIVALAELLQTTPAALLEGVGFQLPDGPAPNQKLFAQDIHGDLIQLPPDPPAGCLAWIETGETTNPPQLLKKADALKQIEQALSSKRKIWVIVE